MSSTFEFEIPDSETNIIKSNLNRALAVNSAMVSFGVFSFIFSVKFGFSSNIIQVFSDGFLNSEDLYFRFSNILNGKIHEVFLFLTTVIWYLIYRRAVESEVYLLSKLHSAANLPKSFSSFSKFSTVVALSVGLTLSFSIMTFSVNYFPLYCFFLLLTSVQDIQGNRILMSQLRSLQTTDNSDIPKLDKRRDYIIKIREECYKYWIYKPQIERITIFIIINILSLFIYMFISGAAFSNVLAHEPKETVERWMWFILRFRNPELEGYNGWIILSYSICISAMIWNEYVMNNWRRERNISLRKIFSDQAEFEKKLAQGDLNDET